jgi:competence protein ComGC
LLLIHQKGERPKEEQALSELLVVLGLIVIIASFLIIIVIPSRSTRGTNVKDS